MKPPDVAMVARALRERAEALRETAADLDRQAAALEGALRGEPVPEPVMSAAEQRTFDELRERHGWQASFAGATTEAEAKQKWLASQGRR